MPSSVTYSYRDSFTATGGTSFGHRRTTELELPMEAGVGYGPSELSAVMHFTAPVGTSYEQILDNSTTGDDAFGQFASNEVLIIINRSTTDTLTLRFDGSAGNHGYILLPAGAHFICGHTGAIVTNAANGDTCVSISAKFTGATGTVEVLVGSINSAFS